MNSQTHNRFAFFVSDPGSDGLLPASVAADVASFSAKNVGSFAVKSVGVEYLESRKKLVLSLGYSDEAGYPVSLTCVPVGKLDTLDTAGMSAAFETAAATVPNVICHEFYANAEDEFFLVLLSR